MSKFINWLQFFADGGASGGDGGDGAGTGAVAAGDVAAADDAGQRLEALGVPKEKAERFRQRMAKRKGAQPAAEKPAAQQTPDPQSAGGETNGEEADSGAQDDGFDVEAALKNPKMQERIQAMMADRGKKATETAKAAQAQLDQSAEVLDALNLKYGVQKKDGQYDLEALKKALIEDDATFEDQALTTGKRVEDVRADWQQQRAEAQRQQKERARVLHERFMAMQQQQSDIQKEYPGFDLAKEINDPDFVALTYPREYGGRGWDARRAYRALHQDEIEKSVAEAVASGVKADVARAQARVQARPKENGGAIPTASAPRDMTKMTPEERRAYIRAKYPPPG